VEGSAGAPHPDTSNKANITASIRQESFGWFILSPSTAFWLPPTDSSAAVEWDQIDHQPFAHYSD
jgi:hypothetical protein